MSMQTKIENALDTIRPYLKKDGGDVEVVAIEDGQLKLRLLGNCSNCEMSNMTMTAGIEEAIKRAVPQITSVVAVDE
jgi:Fe-S cluster biogenesis protein NfuA